MPLSSRFRRWFIVPILVLALLGIRAAPANAFLSALDPAGWAVVAQMAAVLSQAIAIKRQVENVRNQARAEMFGKLAPLAGKLSKVREYIGKARDVASLPTYTPDPATTLLIAGELESGIPPFNDPPVPCSADPDNPRCMPDDARIEAAVLDTVTSTVLASYSNPNVPGLAAPSAAAVTRYQTYLEAMGEAIEHEMANAERSIVFSEQRRLRRRAIIESAMGTSEDWRGCQPAPESEGATGIPAFIDAGDDRLPCTTNNGLGRNEVADGGGTTGLQEQLSKNLQALEEYQEGDASKTQTDTLQTQLLITLARIESQRAELEAQILAEEDETAQLSEGARRRRMDLIGKRQECRNQARTEEGDAAYLRSYYVPPDASSPDVSGGMCHFVEERSDAAVAAMASSAVELTR